MNRQQIDRWMMEGAAAWGRGDGAGALRAAERVLAEARDFAPALHLAGVVYLGSGRAGEAQPLLARAAASMPGNADCLSALATCYFDLDQMAAAADCFRRVAELRPQDLGARMNLGLALERLDRHDEAARIYTALAGASPPHIEACARLGALAEERNEVEHAMEWTERALALAPDNVVANLTLAQLDARADVHRAAAERLQRLLGQSLSATNEAVAASRLGRALDRLGDYAAAFAAFERGNRALALSYGAADGRGPFSLTTIARLRAFFADAEMPVDTAAADARAPVFLVGFPRSGTTLLDRVLAAHPAIAVLEEQETLAAIKRDFVLGEDGLARLWALPAQALESYRAAYWREVDARLPGARELTVIDKLPLNAIFIGVIRRVFPNARFILALRDPRDVCLSCFMQAFGANEAMRHMLDLDTIGGYYAAVMELVELYRERLPLNLLAVRYEVVVADLRGAIEPLLAFLDQPWDDAVLQYRDKLRGTRIDTPSYHQVSRPLYDSAIGRWHHYREQLAPLLPTLTPFVERFGYDAG